MYLYKNDVRNLSQKLNIFSFLIFATVFILQFTFQPHIFWFVLV